MAFPVRIGAIALGILDLYRARPGVLGSTELAHAFHTVDAVGRYMLHWERVPAEESDESYPTVHETAGMVMVQLDRA